MFLAIFFVFISASYFRTIFCLFYFSSLSCIVFSWHKKKKNKCSRLDLRNFVKLGVLGSDDTNFNREFFYFGGGNINYVLLWEKAQTFLPKGKEGYIYREFGVFSYGIISNIGFKCFFLKIRVSRGLKAKVLFVSSHLTEMNKAVDLNLLIIMKKNCFWLFK